MCIILAKNKGIDIPSDNVIRTCFKNNPDGSGLMYQVNGYVKIEKGFMDVEKLLRRLHTLNEKLDLKNKSLVIHFRIGTSGLNDKKTTHPFPISSEIDELRQLSIKCDLGMVHNGIIWEYTKKDSILSDTQNFIKDYVSMFKELNPNFLENKRVVENLKDTIGFSKLCFLDSNDNLTYIGDYVKDENGIIFSNETYKERIYTNYNTTFSGARYAWDDEWETKSDYKWDDKGFDKWDDIDIREPYKDDSVIEWDDLMLLSDDDYIQYENGNLEIVGIDRLGIDVNNNLYEILDYDKDFNYIVNLIAKNVQIYDSNYNEIDYLVGGGCGY